MSETSKYIINFTATPGVNIVNDGEWYYPQVVTQLGNDPPIYLRFEAKRYTTREEALVFANEYAAREVVRFKAVAENFKAEYQKRLLERD